MLKQRGVSWTALAAVLITGGPLIAQEEEEGAGAARASGTLRPRPAVVTVAVDETQTVSYRRGARRFSLMRVTDRALIQGKQGYEVIRTDPGRSAGAVTRAVRSGVEIPVFVNDTGELLAPVGGVILVLSSSWGANEVEAFLAEHRLDESVTRVEWRKNGFVVSTVPGGFAVELADRLGALAGVELAVPNFWSEAVAR